MRFRIWTALTAVCLLSIPLRGQTTGPYTIRKARGISCDIGGLGLTATCIVANATQKASIYIELPANKDGGQAAQFWIILQSIASASFPAFDIAVSDGGKSAHIWHMRFPAE